MRRNKAISRPPQSPKIRMLRFNSSIRMSQNVLLFHAIGHYGKSRTYEEINTVRPCRHLFSPLVTFAQLDVLAYQPKANFYQDVAWSPDELG